jgi:hypothetical protein
LMEPHHGLRSMLRPKSRSSANEHQPLLVRVAPGKRRALVTPLQSGDLPPDSNHIKILNIGELQVKTQIK